MRKATASLRSRSTWGRLWNDCARRSSSVRLTPLTTAPGVTLKLCRTLLPAFFFLPAVSAYAQGRITGTVYDSLSAHARLANATVVLVEASRYATTDARGRFRFDSVPEGRFTLSFFHPVLDSLGLQAPITLVDVKAGRSIDVALATPSPAATYALLCPGPRDIETGAVIGRVRDVDDDSPLSNAVVRTDWTEFTLRAGSVTGHRVGTSAQTNSAGVYILCGIPRQMNLEVYADLAGAIAGPSQPSIDDRLIGRRDFAVSRRDSAARGVVQAESSRSPVMAFPGTASLSGVVRDGQGRPLGDALVGVVGSPRSVRTDAAGAFHIGGIPAGTRTVEARSIGLVPLTVSIDFSTNASRDTVLSLARHAQYLQPITVLGRGNPAHDATGFETRRRQAFGHFITPEDLARHPSFDLIDVLAKSPQVHVEYGTTGRPAPYMRGTGPGYCLPNFFLDGAPFVVDKDHPFEDLSGFVPTGVIRGVEIYSSSEMIPPLWDLSSSTGCGSIVIWTR